MANPPPATSEIRRKLIDTMAGERRELLVFSFLTVLLTPAFIALSVVVLLLALNQLEHSHPSVLWDERVLVHATAGFLGASCGMFFVKPSGQPGLSWKDLVWFAAGLAVLAWILYLSYVSPLRRENPRVFWPLYTGLSILMLGMLGRGYVPRDHYYMRPGEWSMSDPPGDRQAEETDFWLGWASAFPGLLLGSYGNIFGSGWLWEGLNDHGLWTAADVLHSLGSRDPRRAEERLRSLPPKESGRIVRWLSRLEFLRRVRGTLGLTSAGERFLGISEWTVV
jgi:hypothetical protein